MLELSGHDVNCCPCLFFKLGHLHALPDIPSTNCMATSAFFVTVSKFCCGLLCRFLFSFPPLNNSLQSHPASYFTKEISPLPRFLASHISFASFSLCSLPILSPTPLFSHYLPLTPISPVFLALQR